MTPEKLEAADGLARTICDARARLERLDKIIEHKGEGVVIQRPEYGGGAKLKAGIVDQSIIDTALAMLRLNLAAKIADMEKQFEAM
jgi:hypothetical protein